MRPSLWLFIALIMAPLGAQEARVEWRDIHLKTGEKAVVTRTDGSTVAGAVAAATQQELRLRSRSGETVLATADIDSVRVNRNTIRWRVTGTTLGFVAGFVGGVGAALAAGGIFNSSEGVFFSVLGGSTAAGFGLGWMADRRPVTWNVKKP